MSKLDRVHMSAKVTTQMSEQIKAYCKKYKIKTSEFIAIAVRNELRRRGEEI